MRSQGSFFPDSPYNPRLPLVSEENNWQISPETLIKIFLGEYSDCNYIIIDTRYPYEFNAGHLIGALNIYTLAQMNELFFSIPSAQGHKTLIILHCEFSSERAPLMAQSLRKRDRQMNDYPNLFYPQIYILQGGYHRFYHTYKKFDVFFTPTAGYISMFDPSHQDECRQYQKQRPHNNFHYQQGTNRYSGYAFIEFETHDQAAKAVRATAEQRKIDGVEVTIQFSSNYEKEHAFLPSSQSPAPAPIIFTVTSSLQVPLPPSPSQQEKNQSPSAQRQKKSSPSVKHANSTSVHFSGIPTECDRDEIIKLAEQFGEIATTPFYPPSDAPFRYINIEYKTHQSAEAAVHSSAHQRQLHGATIRADWQKGKSDSPASQQFSKSDQVYNPALNKQRKSPPPNPNCTIVRFSGIPIQSIYEEVKNLTHQFGEVKKDSFKYHEQDDSHEGFAIVDYQTHQVAESAVKSSDEKRRIHDVIVSVQWDTVTQQQKISSTPPTILKQYSPPPNTNKKRVHFSGIPVERSEPEVKEIARQFGFYTSFFYRSYDDGRTGFANVEYQTHEQAQAAVAQNGRNMLNGQHIHIYWSRNQQRQQNKPPQNDDQKEQNMKDEDDDY
ncbi:MAG: putative M-phase inducer phosphatase 2 [Streblomastix strix]|uniref:protein-tyrosine-phosphatase n=1 Tax=Streblomastix strix TaxID=222440 RepID=A0A5J4W9P9_9EUKA|nr:MAG: putative M-phase inducer phosphatase 2 [Streblomastix strix]